jgi:hypothetical protein
MLVLMGTVLSCGGGGCGKGRRTAFAFIQKKPLLIIAPSITSDSFSLPHYQPPTTLPPPPVNAPHPPLRRGRTLALAVKPRGFRFDSVSI